METSIQVGSQIDGFTVGDRVFNGGMSTLFRVESSAHPQPLLMKVPLSASEAVVAFETEASILPTLSGPHVPALVAHSHLTRTPYLVMEWVQGQQLETRLVEGRLDLEEAVAVGAALADALHSLHSQGVFHLDVKPSNVILRTDGTAVLIDFGFAHHVRLPDLLAEETRFGVGSAPYLAPEQLLGVRDDPRCDLFALGVVLYELVTGKLPFGEPDTDVRNRFWLDPAPPRSLTPSVAPWLQEIILRCLETRAEQRYQSAAHVAFDLRHPEQIALTLRATKQLRTGFVGHVRRFLRAHSEHSARLRSPDALLTSTPILLGAVDTTNMDDPRHPAIRSAISRLLTQSAEFRLLCLSVIPPRESSLEHRLRLRNWVEPLRLPAQRLTSHAIESDAPADVILEFARRNNVDMIVIGAPSDGGRSWERSTASKVTAGARCSVHVVRVPHRSPVARL